MAMQTYPVVDRNPISIFPAGRQGSLTILVNGSEPVWFSDTNSGRFQEAYQINPGGTLQWNAQVPLYAFVAENAPSSALINDSTVQLANTQVNATIDGTIDANITDPVDVTGSSVSVRNEVVLIDQWDDIAPATFLTPPIIGVGKFASLMIVFRPGVPFPAYPTPSSFNGTGHYMVGPVTASGTSRGVGVAYWDTFSVDASWTFDNFDDAIALYIERYNTTLPCSIELYGSYARMEEQYIDIPPARNSNMTLDSTMYYSKGWGAAVPGAPTADTYGDRTWAFIANKSGRVGYQFRGPSTTDRYETWVQSRIETRSINEMLSIISPVSAASGTSQGEFLTPREPLLVTTRFTGTGTVAAQFMKTTYQS